MRVFRAVWLLVLMAGSCPALLGQAADRLILRNLDILTTRTITGLDEDGLVLDGPRPGGGSRITWDEVERGKVALDQPKFDELLAELGPPLYRLRQRLKVGDYAAATEPAETLYPRFAERKSQTAYLVCQATMWSRLAVGKREAAVEPYLRCFELLRSKAAVSSALPGVRRLLADVATGISPELSPLWFDAAAAKKALPSVQQAIRGLTQPRPEGAYVYYATLAVAAGENSETQRMLPLITGEASAPWRDIVLAQQEMALLASEGTAGQASSGTLEAVERLRQSLGSLPVACRPLALYLVGKAELRTNDETADREGLLSLLTVPAVFGSEQPELAAASLYEAAGALDKLEDAGGAAAVRRELTTRYSGTHFGRKSK